MDQRLQHIVEHYDEMCIGTDEHFRFHCKQCGKCCINREDIRQPAHRYMKTKAANSLVHIWQSIF